MRNAKCFVLQATLAVAAVLACHTAMALEGDGFIQVRTGAGLNSPFGDPDNDSAELTVYFAGGDRGTGASSSANWTSASASGEVQPLNFQSNEPSYAETYASISGVGTSADALAQLHGLLSNTTQDQIIRYTIGFHTEFVLQGPFYNNLEHFVLFGGMDKYETRVLAPNVSTLVDQSVSGGPGLLPAGIDFNDGEFWQWNTGPRTFSGLLYPGQSSTLILRAHSSISSLWGDPADASGTVFSRIDFLDFSSEAVGTINKFQAPSGVDAGWEGPYWTGGSFPNGACTTALLDERSADLTVTMNNPITLGRLAFDSSVGRYTVAGAGSLTLSCGAGGVGLDVLAGTHTINVPIQVNNNLSSIAKTASDSLTIMGPITYAPGVSLTKNGDGTLALPALPNSHVAVNGGILKLQARVAPQVVTGLYVNYEDEAVAPVKLDLVNNDLVIDYTGGSPRLAVREMLKAGRAGGTWEGPGISASASNDDPVNLRALGYGEAGTLGITSYLGVPVDTTTVIVKYTFPGDLDLNQNVNFDDLLAQAQNYELGGREWAHGDIDYDDDVDFDDLLVLAQNYGKTGTVRESGGDGVYQVYLELAAGAPWILADALSHPEGLELFGPYMGIEGQPSGYQTQLQNYSLKPPVVPEPGVLGTLILPMIATRKRRG